MKRVTPAWHAAAFALLAALFLCAHAAEPDEDQVRRYPMTRVNRIEITSITKPVSAYTYFHSLDWGECQGEGRITFANGDVVTATIEVGDRGILSPQTGKHAGEVFYFSCEACDETDFGSKLKHKSAR
jgi:hypothetical protein